MFEIQQFIITFEDTNMAANILKHNQAIRNRTE